MKNTLLKDLTNGKWHSLWYSNTEDRVMFKDDYLLVPKEFTHLYGKYIKCVDKKYNGLYATDYLMLFNYPKLYNRFRYNVDALNDLLDNYFELKYPLKITKYPYIYEETSECFIERSLK